MLLDYQIILPIGSAFFIAVPSLISALKPPELLPFDFYFFVLKSSNLTGFCYVGAVLLSYQMRLPTPWLAVTTWGLLAGFIDYHSKFLPKQLIHLGIYSALFLISTELVLSYPKDSLLIAVLPLLKALLGSLVWAGIYFYFWLRGSKLGFGDVRLAALLGLVLGYSNPILVLLAIGLAGIIAILSFQKGSFAFGPMMLLSAYLIALADINPLC